MPRSSRTRSSPKTFGSAQNVEHGRTAAMGDSCGTRNEWVLVEGAGWQPINGLYKRIATHDDNTATYSMKSMDDRDHISIALCETASGSKEWRIIHKANKTLLYFAPMSVEDPNFPPSTGWAQPTNSPTFLSSLPTVTVLWPRKPSVLPTIAVVEPVAIAYEKLLFSEEFSDVQFICEDGVTIPAHKNILAASSPYFKSVFNGPWKENENGILNTPHPAHIVKEMLTLIYSGKTDSQLVRDVPLPFISIASEFELPWLKALAEPYCILSLEASSLKTIWQAGRLYDSVPLRNACIKYTKMNSLVVLTESAMIDLKNEDSDSWQDFVEAVGQSSPNEL